MNQEQLIKEINRLRLLRYTWKQIKETLFTESNPPSIATIKRWAKGAPTSIPLHQQPLRIAAKYEEEVREVFVKQLKKMGYNNQEIKKELKRLIP
tara:strand:- start:190 stop:474 length:285 start_codon:yes stop_codon:yes gene_type:complete